MAVYTATFNGRNKGAIGITYPIKTLVEGENPARALANLYDRFECLLGLELERVKVFLGPIDWKCNPPEDDPYPLKPKWLGLDRYCIVACAWAGRQYEWQRFTLTPPVIPQEGSLS